MNYETIQKRYYIARSFKLIKLVGIDIDVEHVGGSLAGCGCLYP